MKQGFFNRFYTVKEFYIALYKGIRTFKYMNRTKKKQMLSAHFIERIMLAVTEVNGCEVCSYAHTKIALEQGMGNEEIKMLLAGDTREVSEEEMTAVIFAQHYADTRGHPSSEAWERVVTTYGMERALGILGAIRTMMIGNIYGIALSACKNRLKGKKIETSNLLYEIRMILSIIILLPTTLIHSLIANIRKVPVVDFP